MLNEKRTRILDSRSGEIQLIWEEYHSKLHAFINKRVNNASLADDILQEIFMKICSKIDMLKSPDKIQPWIFSIARNAIVDYYRTHKPDLELPESLSVPVSEPDDSTRLEIADGLLRMIQKLPVHYREFLMMSEIEGLKQAEIADRQKVSKSCTKSRIQRGRALLKDMLLQCCRFEFDGQGRVIDYQKKKCANC
jgi:RNA polymerase sigma-70 factor (ECF subfamily)